MTAITTNNYSSHNSHKICHNNNNNNNNKNKNNNNIDDDEDEDDDEGEDDDEITSFTPLRLRLILYAAFSMTTIGREKNDAFLKRAKMQS